MSKVEIEKAPILITGAARSGTSMVAGCIDISGGFGGNLTGPTRYNAKGQFENGFIRDQIVKPYLRQIGVDPKGQNPLPDTKNMAIPNDWRLRIEETIIHQGYKEGPWYYKGAKACLMWPVWHHAFPDAKWIIVRRRTADIAQSCLDTGFMNAYSKFEDWIKWVNHHEDKWVEMIKNDLNVKIVWPDRMVHGDYSQLYEAIEWLGLPWKFKELTAHVDPKLWKAKEKAGMKLKA